MQKNTIYAYSPKLLNGIPKSLSDYQGKVLLIVNTASGCGFTPQLEGLQQLYTQYKDQGLVVLGFPCNDFGKQEPLEGEQINEFCAINYGVDFPIFEKVTVKGSLTHPLFQFLGDKKLNGKVGAKPRWNFHKYLINRQGQVVDYFYPFTKPNAPRLVKRVKQLLAEK